MSNNFDVSFSSDCALMSSSTCCSVSSSSSRFSLSASQSSSLDVDLTSKVERSSGINNKTQEMFEETSLPSYSALETSASTSSSSYSSSSYSSSSSYRSSAILKEEIPLKEKLYELSDRACKYNRNNFGLLGILKVIRMTDPDLNVLALGTDLTTLGLNLNSSDCLFGTFTSPWFEQSSTTEMENFNIPACYRESGNQLKISNLHKFKLETLFYVFYNLPRDILQAYAAVELYNRKWMYHQHYKKWFSIPDDRLILFYNECGETGNQDWTYFDPNKWIKKVYTGIMNIRGFLSAKEMRSCVEQCIKAEFVNSSSSSFSSSYGNSNIHNQSQYVPNSQSSYGLATSASYTQNIVTNGAMMNNSAGNTVGGRMGRSCSSAGGGTAGNFILENSNNKRFSANSNNNLNLQVNYLTNLSAVNGLERLT